jgi:hypothetical protein
MKEALAAVGDFKIRGRIINTFTTVNNQAILKNSSVAYSR